MKDYFLWLALEAWRAGGWGLALLRLASAARAALAGGWLGLAVQRGPSPGAIQIQITLEALSAHFSLDLYFTYHHLI